MGRKPTVTGGVSPLNERIQIRFTWHGKEYRPTLNLKPTATNLKAANRLREQILREIEVGTFQLGHHFPEYRFMQRAAPVSAAGEVLPHLRTFQEWANIYFEFLARSAEHSTLTIYQRHLKSYWADLWGDLNPRQITHEMVQLRLARLAKGVVDPNGSKHRPLARKSQNNILIPLRGVFKLICKQLPNLPNPVDGIDNLKTTVPAPDPFTPQEVELILATLRKRDPEVADYYEFMMFAGLRDSEQIALRWEDVDVGGQSVMVRRARVLGQDKERTKTYRDRVVELNARAWGVIQRRRAVWQLVGGPVFRNPATGQAWHDDQRQRVVFRSALKTCGVRYRPPKECRDTSVTVALMAGADPAWVAAQHGHSVITMLQSYAKWLPKGDDNRNLNKVNLAIGTPLVEPISAVGNDDFRSRPAVETAQKEKTH